MKAKGLTLIELLVTLAIISLVALMSIPNFQRFISQRELANATAQVVHLVHHARLMALAHGGAFLCDGEQGCQRFSRPNSLAVHLPATLDGEAASTPFYWATLPTHISVQWRRFRGHHLYFNQQGRALFMNGHFLLCHEQRSDVASKVVINWNGRARIETTDASNC